MDDIVVLRSSSLAGAMVALLLGAGGRPILYYIDGLGLGPTTRSGACP